MEMPTGERDNAPLRPDQMSTRRNDTPCPSTGNDGVDADHHEKDKTDQVPTPTGFLPFRP